MSPELSKLIELQELDLEIQRISERLSSIPAERDQIESEFGKYAAEFLTLKSKHEQTLADRKQLESELVTTQQLHEKYKQDLMRVRNEKEYTTALREIDATKKQISTFETEILSRMDELDQLETELKVASPAIEVKRAEVDSGLRELDREQDEVSAAMAALEDKRNLITASITPLLLATYNRVARLRRGQALSEIRNGSCSACSMKIRPKVISDVRRGDQLNTCDNCSRILFIRNEPSEAAEVAISGQGSTEG